MTSSTVPIYRHGRKFYVSTEEYERMRSEERRQRRAAVQRSHNLPTLKSYQTTSRAPSTPLYNPIHRSNSTPQEHQYGILKTPHLPANIITSNNNTRRQSTRLSRSPLRYNDDRDDVSSIISSISKKKSPSSIRSTSSDKVIDIRRTPQPTISSHTNYVSDDDDDGDIKRPLSAEIVQALPLQSKQSSRRPVPTTVSDYGMSPTSTFSMTPTDQTYTQTNGSKLTSYFARMKQSSLNSPTKSSTSASSGPGSLFETGMQGTDHVYTVLGSSNRRPGGQRSRSNSNNSNTHEYYHRDTVSGSLSDDNSSSLSMLIQRRHTDVNRHHQRPEYTVETDGDYGQQRDLWTRSTMRSQSSDGLTEKKRVRFADMEGFTLETIPDKTHLRSPINNRLLTRRQNVKISNDIRAQPQPFYNSLYQATMRVGGSKLATDV